MSVPEIYTRTPLFCVMEKVANRRLISKTIYNFITFFLKCSMIIHHAYLQRCRL